MDLSQPAALWLLLLLPLPLFLSRRRRAPVRLTVSSLHLWRLAIASRSRSLATRRIPRSWLVALQMAAIAATVLALSGPIVTTTGRHVTLVMDVSASMSARDDGGTRLDAARERALAFVRTLPRSATVTVIAAAQSPRALGTYPAADPRLAAVIDSLVPTAGGADLTAAISVAAMIDARNVTVFTDERARSGATSGTAADAQWVTVGGPVDNAAIIALSARRLQLGSPAGQVLVSVQNFSPRPRQVTVEVLVDGRIVDLLSADVAAHGTRTLSPVVSDLGRVVTARLREDAGMTVDNTRSVPAPPNRQIRVVLFGDPGSFLDAALAAHPLVRLERNPRPADGVLRVDGRGDADVVVCDRCNTADGVVLPTLTVWPQGLSTVQGEMTLADASHPVAASLDINQLTAVTSPATATTPGTVIARIGGVPAVTASDEPMRRVDVHVDLTRSDFVLDPAFAVLIANALDWLAATRVSSLEVSASEPMLIEPTGGGRAMKVGVTGPDGRQRAVQQVGPRFIVADTDTAGIYSVTINDIEHQVAVNPVTDGESNLLLDGEQQPRAATLPLPAVAREPLAIAGWFALLALVMIGLEWRLRFAGNP